MNFGFNNNVTSSSPNSYGQIIGTASTFAPGIVTSNNPANFGAPIGSVDLCGFVRSTEPSTYGQIIGKVDKR